MIALDTSVVVRYLVNDDAQQAAAARALMDQLTREDPGYICREVIVEVAWVLERSYRLDRARVAAALMDLTASDSLVVENADDVAAAAYRYGQGGPGFSDRMILKAAHRSGCAPLHTLDKALAQITAAALVEHTTPDPPP